MLQPHKGNNKMGSFLKMDNELKLNICSVNHYYQSGTMLNNRGNGLEQHTINTGSSVYSSAVDYENYVLLNPVSTLKYNAAFYTKKVTAAKMVKGSTSMQGQGK
jgi:hypothetical protein